MTYSTDPNIKELNTTDIRDQGHQDQLENIEIQRKTLEQLFKITRSVENLRLGLETTLLVGKSTGHTSEKAISLYQKLNAKTLNLSNHEVHMRLKHIDQKIKKHLAETFYLVENLDDEIYVASLGDTVEVTHNMITDFRRSAQTMIALQVLLNSRGLPVTPKVFDVSKKVLLEKINSTKIREQQCRKQLVHDTVEMEKDIQLLLSTKTCTEQMRPFLQDILTGLKANCQHVELGLNIHEMPYAIDNITITDCATEVNFDDSKELSGTTESKQSIPAEPKPTEPQTTEPQRSVQPPAKKTKKRQGFWQRLISWADTPLDTSVKDIFKK